MAYSKSKEAKVRRWLVSQGFNFSYAGRVHVYLVPAGRHEWRLVREGFSYDFSLNTVFFNKDKVERSNPMPLYEAMRQFHLHVSAVLAQGLDWYDSESFDYDVYFKERLDSIFEFS